MSSNFTPTSRCWEKKQAFIFFVRHFAAMQHTALHLAGEGGVEGIQSCSGHQYAIHYRMDWRLNAQWVGRPRFQISNTSLANSQQGLREEQLWNTQRQEALNGKCFGSPLPKSMLENTDIHRTGFFEFLRGKGQSIMGGNTAEKKCFKFKEKCVRGTPLRNSIKKPGCPCVTEKNV